MIEIHETPVFDPGTMTYRHVFYDGPPTLASWATEDRVEDSFLKELSQVPENLYAPIPGIKERWAAEVERCKALSAPFGEVGKRYEIELEYVDSGHPRATEYGVSVKHTFKSGANVFHWWTGKGVSLAVGQKRTVKATVKDHVGRETLITRVSPLKGEEGFTYELKLEDYDG